jgi:hypothetical protein
MMQLKQYASEVRNDLKYGWWRWRARGNAPSLSDPDRAIVADLRRTGASVTSLKALGIPGSPEILAAGDAVTDNLAQRPVPAGEFTVAADGKEIAAWPQLIRWGLDERLLAIVRAYIGMPVAYRGLTVRRDVFGGPENETRMWHRDNEDNRILKIIVYLNDIGEDGGPFEFLPVDRTPPIWRVPLVDSSRVSEAEMTRLAPRESWRPCTGLRGTAVFVDTCRVYHRGRIAAHKDRRTLFYCYNSRRPLNPKWCGPLFDRDTFLAAIPPLSATQRDAIRTDY